MGDAIDGGVNGRSDSKLRSTGECDEYGEFGEFPDGDKGGVWVPSRNQSPR